MKLLNSIEFDLQFAYHTKVAVPLVVSVARLPLKSFTTFEASPTCRFSTCRFSTSHCRRIPHSNLHHIHYLLIFLFSACCLKSGEFPTDFVDQQCRRVVLNNLKQCWTGRNGKEQAKRNLAGTALNEKKSFNKANIREEFEVASMFSHLSACKNGFDRLPTGLCGKADFDSKLTFQRFKPFHILLLANYSPASCS